MSATYQALTPQGVKAMLHTQTQLKPELAAVVRKIHALRTVTKTTGFFTTKTIIDILGKLSPDDLVAVGEALQLKPREMPHTTGR
jgi:hypothetical protein